MIHILITVLLGPLLLIQGMYVRRVTPILPEPEGEREGVSGRGEKLRLLIVGDSAAAGVGCQHQRQALLGQLLTILGQTSQVEFKLAAKTGDKTSECIDRLITNTERDFDVVVTSLGVNDVTGMTSKKRFRRQQTELIALIQRKYKPKKIVLSGLPPMRHFPALPQPLRWYLGRRAQELDKLIAAICREQNLIYINLDFTSDPSLAASDGFHPGPKAYTIWADLINRGIQNSQQPS